MKNANRLSKLAAELQSMKSAGTKLTGVLALFAVLQSMPEEASAQTMVTKKQYETILDNARLSQQAIGEDAAKFLFGGGLERRIQTEIEHQNADHPAKGQDGKFSLFNDKEIIARDTKNPILSKKKILEVLRNELDSLLQQDAKILYLAFHNYQESGRNVVGHKKGKGELGDGYNLAAFPVSIDVDYLENPALPYQKDKIVTLKQEFELFYNKYFSAWKADALTNRSNEKVTSYASADLIALEKERQALATALSDTYLEPMVDRVFKQYYSRDKDDVNSPSKKK